MYRGEVNLRNGADVRAAMIQAATETLSRKGLKAVTIKEVARAAGVSPALIYRYFEDEDRLPLGVMRKASSDYREGARKFVASLIPHENALHRSSTSPRLRYALFALGLRDPRFLPELAKLLENGRRGIEHALNGAGLSHAPGTPALLLACFDRLALQKFSDPDLDLHPTRELLTILANHK